MIHPRKIFLFTFVFPLLFASQPAKSSEPVALELVLAVDTSTSVDAREYGLQRDGLVRAFRHSSVLGAITALEPEGLAVSVLQWSGRGDVWQDVWHRIRTADDAERFARHLTGMKRRLSGFTDIATAIEAATISLRTNAYEGKRKAIDVSGDGVSDRHDPADARDRAIGAGITINGLVVHSLEYDLGDLARIELYRHYAERVIGGPGAFVMEAGSFDDFAEAIRRKLVREILGSGVAGIRGGRLALSDRASPL